MKPVKKHIIIPVIILPLLVLIILRTTNHSLFRYDAEKWARSSFDNSNIRDKATSATDKELIINLDGKMNKVAYHENNTIFITADSVLSGKYITLIRDHDGPVLLSSSDDGLAARIWMILSQTGLKNIYILPSDKENEVFKYKFRPDSITRPE
jgi:hypothetical protein